VIHLACECAGGLLLFEIADQVGDTSFEGARNPDQARKADAVGAVLVLLHLLKRNPDSLPQIALRMSKFLAALADPSTERNV